MIHVAAETALKALEHMPRVLEARPQSFPSRARIIEWALSTKQCRNPLAASISTTSQYTKKIAASDESIYVPIVDLARTKHHWSGWFEGMSAAFLSLSLMRVLVLAERDYLDRPLMMGQMQGRF